ncbi:LytTR family DNA-binding domain-containing protein [Clostridium malenominatum]|uniref:Stage 0 sporulation protein A homolog n=1 Tax=Clostridium malenominatum TaxID=1539 RepID=A0ABN1J1T8_9CLOT
MMNINCIIVEDELPAAEELKYTLNEYSFINVLDMAHDGESGLHLIKSTNPDVVFLDINMPLKSGMELAKEIKIFNKNIDIIFVTAYDEYAVNAFEVEALDYILKPFDEKRIFSTINRLYNKKANILSNDTYKKTTTVNKIPCEKHGKIILVPISEIYYCYVENEKVYVKTKKQIYPTPFTMYKLEDRTNLFRSHRSYLVNLDNIKELYSWFNGTYKLVMNDDDNSEIPISRKNVRNLKDILGM